MNFKQDYFWYCKHCEERLGAEPTNQDSKVTICDDSGECPYSTDWGGDPCGYVVCPHCHRPASDITENQLKK
jgi:hypothetical protein